MTDPQSKEINVDEIMRKIKEESRIGGESYR